MGRGKTKLKMNEPEHQMPVYNRRKVGFAKKARELSILCDIPLLALSFNPHGKADLVLGSNTNFKDIVSSFIAARSEERYGSQLEGIKALQKNFKGNNDHEINVQQLMNLGGAGTSHAIQQGQQSSINMTREEIKQWQQLLALLENIDQGHMINSIEQLKLAEAAVECLIHLNTNNMMKMLENQLEILSLRDRASASTSAFQHFTNQVAMNHPGPLNGNMMNQGTNLLQPNMDLGSNSDPVSDEILIAAPPGPDECLIHLNTNNMLKMLENQLEMLSLRDRASTSTSAFQHFTNQVAMNHPGPLNGNTMNQGTNLLQPNMDLGSNSDPVSDDLLMAAPPGPDDQSLYDNHDGASEGGFGACAPGN